MTTENDPQPFDSDANRLDETIILELGEAIKKLDKKWKARNIGYDFFIGEWRQNQARLKKDFRLLKRLIIQRANEGIKDEKHWERFNTYNKKTLYDPAQKLREDIVERLNIESNPSPHSPALGDKAIGSLALGSALAGDSNLNQLTPPEFIETAKRVSEWLYEVLSDIIETAKLGQDLPNPKKPKIEQPKDLNQEDNPEPPLQSPAESKPPSTADLAMMYAYLEKARYFAGMSARQKIMTEEAPKHSVSPNTLYNDFAKYRKEENRKTSAAMPHIKSAIELLKTQESTVALKYAEADLTALQNSL